MKRIEAIRAGLKFVEEVGFDTSEGKYLAEALDTIEKAYAFLNSKTVYYGTYDDVPKKKAAVEALERFFSEVEEPPQEVAESPAEVKPVVRLPVIP